MNHKIFCLLMSQKSLFRVLYIERQNESNMNKKAILHNLVLVATTLLTLCTVGTRQCFAQGETEERTVKTDPFSAIRNNGCVDIHFAQEPQKDIRVRDAKNNYVTFKVEDGTLIIDYKDHKKKRGNIGKAEVWISAPTLNKLTGNGPTNFFADKITGNKFEVLHNATGKYCIESLSVDQFNVQVNGVASFDCNVDAAETILKNKGVSKGSLTFHGGNVDIYNLGSWKLNITADNAKEVKLNNNGEWNAHVGVKASTARLINRGVSGGEMNIKATDCEIINNGASQADITFAGDNITVANHGAMSTTLQVDCKKLKAENKGDGKMSIAGTADDTNIGSAGVMNIDTSRLNKF